MSVQSSYTPETEPIPEDGGSSQFVPALVVIDMQNDFVSGSLAVPGGGTIIHQVNELIDLPAFKLRVATRDFHPENHTSFAISHDKPLFSKVVIFHPEDKEASKGLEQVLWPVHCVANTAGVDFVPELETAKFDHVLLKGTHPKVESYSAFQDIWARNTTELPGMLKENGITDVFFVGLAGDYCVKFTAKDSADFGFKSWVIVDGVKCIDEGRDAWDEMKEKGVKFTTVDYVLKRLG